MIGSLMKINQIIKNVSKILPLSNAEKKSGGKKRKSYRRKTRGVKKRKTSIRRKRSRKH